MEYIQPRFRNLNKVLNGNYQKIKFKSDILDMCYAAVIRHNPGLNKLNE